MSLLERPSDRDRGGDRDDRVRKKETEKKRRVRDFLPAGSFRKGSQ